MSLLPRVTEHTRESLSRQFDDLGPLSCVTEITADLKSNNPELLDMAEKCARDVGESDRIMVGFCMFYGMLAAQAKSERTDLGEREVDADISVLPRVSIDTREQVVLEIDAKGPRAFTEEYVEQLEQDNPELLQLAHNFATRHTDYLRIMQGMVLLWASLAAQLRADRGRLH
jgi:hypothetical protein